MSNSNWFQKLSIVWKAFTFIISVVAAMRAKNDPKHITLNKHNGSNTVIAVSAFLVICAFVLAGLAFYNSSKWVTKYQNDDLLETRRANILLEDNKKIYDGLNDCKNTVNTCREVLQFSEARCKPKP